MAFRKTIILPISFLLGGCAQVGTITGGEKDTVAPSPTEMNPPNESVNYTGNSFEITFNEFIQLKDPLQNVVIVPDHAALKTSLRNKTVRVEWEDTLQNNTTYVVYLNGAVEDVTENNDSLMTYVFSTGPSVDSINYSVRVADAFTNELAANMTVGLFTDRDQNKPYYFTKTDNSGTASFSYVAEGSYYLRAFEDVNKDLKIQSTEAVAFKGEPIVLTESVRDTIPLRVYNPPQPPKILSLKAIPPGALLLESNRDLKESVFLLNGNPVLSDNIQYPQSQKTLVFTDLNLLTNVSVVVQGKELNDTVTLRLTERDKLGKIRPEPFFSEGTLRPNDSFTFSVNDLVRSVDTSLLLLRDMDDSTRITVGNVTIDQNKFTIHFERNNHKRIELAFMNGAIQTVTGHTNEDQKNSVILLIERDVAILRVDATAYTCPIVVELLKEKNVVSKTIVTETRKFSLTNVMPGEYKIRIISDINQNGHWDEGDLVNGTQPERVDWFSVPKVRANWETDILLRPER